MAMDSLAQGADWVITIHVPKYLFWGPSLRFLVFGIKASASAARGK